MPPPRRRAALAAAVLVAALGALPAASAAPQRGAPASGASANSDRVERVATRVAAGECTRYAAPRGSDGSRGTRARPFRTVQRLADSLRPGQTGCLRGGLYADTDDGYVLKVERGGRRSAPVRIRSFPGERARLAGRIWVPEGSNNVVLSHLAVTGSPGEITFKVYAQNVVVARNNITNRRLGKSCLLLGSTSGYGQAVRPIVRGNRFHDCGRPEDGNLGHGIYAQNVVGGTISGNVFWNIQAYAIQFYPYAQRTRFANNVIDGGSPSVRGGILFGGNDDYASSGNVVERNVIAYARTSNITSGWDDQVGSGNIARRNCVWGAADRNIDDSDGGFVATRNVVAPPLFVARARHDYRLRPRSRCLRVVAFDAAARLRSGNR